MPLTTREPLCFGFWRFGNVSLGLGLADRMEATQRKEFDLVENGLADLVAGFHLINAVLDPVVMHPSTEPVS